MKRFNAVLTLACLCLSGSFLAAQEGKVFFDVKTKFLEKAKLTHIKAVTEYLLIKSEWAGVTEYGAQYALWIKNYRKVQNGDEVTVNLDIEIRRPKGFSEGDRVDSRSIEVKFDLNEDNRGVNNNYELYRQKLSNFSDKMIREAQAVGERVYDETMNMGASFHLDDYKGSSGSAKKSENNETSGSGSSGSVKKDKLNESRKDWEIELSVNPERGRIYETVNIKFSAMPPSATLKEDVEYKYKLDVPGDWMGGIQYAKNKWSNWISGNGGNMSLSDFVIEGKYTFTVVYRDKKTGEESDKKTVEFQQYWEYPEIQKEAISINWKYANSLSSENERNCFLASEWEEAFNVWYNKYVYQYNLLKLSADPNELLNTALEAVTEEIVISAIAPDDIIGKILAPVDIYDIIKGGALDLILIYRNLDANRTFSNAYVCKRVWRYYEKKCKK